MKTIKALAAATIATIAIALPAHAAFTPVPNDPPCCTQGSGTRFKPSPAIVVVWA